MKKLQFKIEINAPAEKVYDTILGISDLRTYEQWTAEFDPTSTYEGSWQKGSKIYFIAIDKGGKRVGMVSEIAENIVNRFVSIRHYGILDGRMEITEGAEVEKWLGGLENYSFAENNGITTVSIDVDVTETHIDYFNTKWPAALNKLKAIAEK